MVMVHDNVVHDQVNPKAETVLEIVKRTIKNIEVNKRCIIYMNLFRKEILVKMSYEIY